MAEAAAAVRSLLPYTFAAAAVAATFLQISQVLLGPAFTSFSFKDPTTMIAPPSADQDIDRQRQSQYLDFLDDEVSVCV